MNLNCDTRWHPSRVQDISGELPGMSSLTPQPPANFHQPFRLRWDATAGLAGLGSRAAGGEMTDRPELPQEFFGRSAISRHGNGCTGVAGALFWLLRLGF